MRFPKRLTLSGLILSATITLQGCQYLPFWNDAEIPSRPTIENLQPAVITLPKTTISELSVGEVIQHYSELLPLLSDPEKQLKVLHRLADLKLKQGEQLMAEQAKDELDIAVSAYTGLLEKYPERAENDTVLYQLAKTYELKGEAELNLATLTRLVKDYPATSYLAEVQFRRGEILFAWSDYAQAQAAFEAVIATQDPTFLTNAYYMQGWSQFKQNAYAASLPTFSRVLDQVFAKHQDRMITNLSWVEDHQKTLVDDLLRVMGLALSYEEGAASLANLFQQVGSKHYEVLVYEHYSTSLLEKELYTNALEVFRVYIDQHPLDLWAPKFHIRIIETLNLARFVTTIHDEKQRFVREYGLHSAFWAKHESNPPSSPSYGESEHLAFAKSYLEPFLIELADISYIKGQTAEKKAPKQAQPTEDMRTHFAQASAYNREFIATFPSHAREAERLFLVAESEYKLHRWLAAINAYEQVGYQYPEFDKAAEAAYAVILAYTEFSETWASLSPEEQANWQTTEQLNRLRFVQYHAQDSRALDVLFVALSFEFNQKHFQDALVLADQLLQWPASFAGAPSASDVQQQETILIKAHSYYALQDYVLAEQAYVEALAVLPKQDKRRLALIENLAASVYKQADAFLLAGQTEQGIEQLLRVGKVAPQSSLRQNAEYDAANYLLELKQWPRAISVLTTFRAAYPQHELISTLPAKLALAYRETEQWSLAADELKRMLILAKTAQEKQDIAFMVAELYDKAENDQQAILSYREYANTYAEPVDMYIEAVDRLAQLYEKTGDPLKRRFWLAKLMKTVDALGAKADDRMRYLAASASAVLANDAFIQYKAIKLSLPLDKSLTKKTQALEAAMVAYQKTASYGISSFSTEAGYRMAELYSHLSAALMASDRPDNLNELELEQYEILLEEQVFPFEDNAIDIHEQNASRAWAGLYDDWVKRSFTELRRLLPGRYAKDETVMEVMDVLY